MTEISFRATFAGHIDGERVAWTYRAYNDEGAPYVLALDTEFGMQTIVQAPTGFLHGIEAEDEDRENAIAWVHRLTELVDKARMLDVIVGAVYTDDLVFDLHQAIDSSHEHVGEEDCDDEDDWDDDDDDDWDCDDDEDEDELEAFIVPELTDAESDSEWVDRDGDHYKHIDGRWCLSYGGTSQWHTAVDDLTQYAPYTAVRS